MLLEVCVDTLEGANAAIAGGADRIELCSALETGGLTPSIAFMRAAAKFPVPVVALIRPRPGDFDYADREIGLMVDDIRAARAAGLAGVVVGATNNGELSKSALARLVEAADGMTTTLHRAIDVVDHPVDAVDEAVRLGFKRILSSGGKRTALKGASVLLSMIERANGRISVMPGAGVTYENANEILTVTGAIELHASCRLAVAPSSNKSRLLGFEPPDGLRQTDADVVRTLKAAIRQHGKN